MIDFIGSRVLAAANDMTTGFAHHFPVISANSPIKFEETNADSVASGSANLANSCASFAEPIWQVARSQWSYLLAELPTPFCVFGVT